MTKQEIVAKIKQTAAANYNEAYGWSMIIECLSDKEIEQNFVADGWSLQKAMAEARSWVADHSDQYDEIKATAW